MTIKTAVASGVISLALTGCGTAVTVLQDDAGAAQSLRRQKTYCQSIPRVYSGLAYDFCVLNAPPDPTGILVSLVLLDLALSGALDTAVLPYTIYRQGVDGNIQIYWRPTRG
ncbi:MULTISPECIES: YceK/YidQ family lipoprotein [unclassified Pseudomonas]|uniref:YceK/YidQ family lipoprotein n=1 Tax=Pseudomonas sp. MYb327 TaxID=2745230 RepID=A0AAU8E1R3_9PSED